MRKKVFRFLSILMVFLMAISSISYATVEEKSATNILLDESSATQTLSEYDYFKEIKMQPKKELMEMGMDEKQIDFIKNFDFHEYAEQMKKSSDTELRKRGLSEEDIRTVRTAKNEDIILAATMGNVTYRIAKIYYTYDSAKGVTSLTTNATWEWSTKPVSCFTDIVATGTSGGFKKDSGTSTIYYYPNGDKTLTAKTETVAQNTANSGLNTVCKFSMKKTMAYGSTRRDCYAMKGSSMTNWSVSGNIKTVGIASNYGHSKFSCSPSLSVSASGVGLSFTPSALVEFGTEAYSSITR